MGVSANQSRMMTLTARMHDLELRAQQISNEKVVMSLKSEAYATQYSDAMNRATSSSDGSVDESMLRAAQAEYDKNTSEMSRAEKLLDLELSQINTEHSAVTTEYDSVKSLISDNTDRSFSLFG